MAFTDPTSGVGYAFGEVLPSADMTTIATQQPGALDVIGGGTYSALGANISLAASSSRTFTFHTNVSAIFTELAEFNGGVQIDATSTVSDGIGVTWEGATKTNLPKITSRDYSFSIPLVPQLNSNDRFNFSNTDSAWNQSDVTDAGLLSFAVGPLPSGQSGWVFRDLLVWVDGAGGSGGAHGGVPATKPTIRLRRLQHGTNVAASIGNATDPETTQPAYDDRHTISIEADGTGAMNDDPDTSGAVNSSYYFEFTGEASTNAQANSLHLRGADAILTVTSIGP